MGALHSLSSRAIIGTFYQRLEQATALSYIGSMTMRFDSDQGSEQYNWLGQVPAMREWIGGRHAKGLNDNGLTIENKKYEATLKVSVDDIRRDKTGQIDVRVGELATRAVTHECSLVSTLILNGATGVCYDGQYFFDTDHSEGDSGAQSNKISVDISAIPLASHGTVTDPAVGEMAKAILLGIQAMQGLVDDQGEPMNEMASEFIVMVPTSLYATAAAAVTNATIDGGDTNTIPTLSGMNIRVVQNARLNTWTDRFAIFRADGQVKPFILQEEESLSVAAKAEGSEHEFDNDEHVYGIKRIGNAGYGMWQHAVQVILI